MFLIENLPSLALSCLKKSNKLRILVFFRKRVSSHIWQLSNIYGNPATFNKRERNRERIHPKNFN